jgi:hypothetical protein
LLNQKLKIKKTKAPKKRLTKLNQERPSKDFQRINKKKKRIKGKTEK